MWLNQPSIGASIDRLLTQFIVTGPEAYPWCHKVTGVVHPGQTTSLLQG